MNKDQNGNILVDFVCSCGATVLTRRNRLSTKKFCSTTCPNLKQKRAGNIIGKHFGDLKVIKEVANNKDTAALYDCSCVCGTIITKRGGDLRYGKGLGCSHIRTSLEEKKKKQAARAKSWYQANPGRRHKSYRRLRTPKWLSSEHRKEMNDVYLKAQAFTSQSNIKYVVDHIVPLRGKNVSGLHVPWNLQVVPEAWNLKKSNRYAELWSDSEKQE